MMAGPKSLFTEAEAQLKEIILQYGVLASLTLVLRWFRKQYPDIPNSQIPSARQFGRSSTDLRRLEVFISTVSSQNRAVR